MTASPSAVAKSTPSGSRFSPSFLDSARAPASDVKRSATEIKTSEHHALDDVDKELLEFLEEWDQDGDGEYSVEEVLMIAKKFRQKERQMKSWRRYALCGLLCSIFLLAAMLLVTLAAVQMAKDTRPNGDGVLVTNDGRAAAVAHVLRQTELESIRDLADAELSELQYVALDINGDQYTFKVASSIRYSANATSKPGLRPAVDLFFTAGRFTQMTIGDNITVLSRDGTALTIDSSNAGGRRLNDDNANGKPRSIAALSGRFEKEELAYGPWSHIGSAPWTHIGR